MTGEKVALVFLYGCDINSPLKSHLDNVARVGNMESIKRYILCGSPTQQESFPWLTEARVAMNYLKNKVPLDSYFYLEEKSFTTYDNALFGSRKINSLDRNWFEISEVFVFVEALKVLKAANLCRHFLPEFRPDSPDKRIRFVTESWEARHPLWELWSTNMEVLAMYVPFLARYARWNRKRKSKNR